MSQGVQHQQAEHRHVLEYYERHSEWDRLAEGRGRLEFLRTTEIMLRNLPSPPAVIADIGGGALMGAFGIMAALHERERSGEGQLVDVSMADGALSWLTLIAARHFADTGRQAEIVEVKGSVEIAPLTGLVDGIVDLTATGTTLKENHLVEREEICECTARLIANPVAHKLRAAEIDRLVERIREVVPA